MLHWAFCRRSPWSGHRRCGRHRTRYRGRSSVRHRGHLRLKNMRLVGPWRTVDQLEYAIFEYLDWWNHAPPARRDRHDPASRERSRLLRSTIRPRRGRFPMKSVSTNPGQFSRRAGPGGGGGVTARPRRDLSRQLEQAAARPSAPMSARSRPAAPGAAGEAGTALIGPRPGRVPGPPEFCTAVAIALERPRRRGS